MPFLWVLALLLLAVFLKSLRWQKTCLLSALALLLLFSNPFLSNEAWRAWEVEAMPIKEVEKYDAAIILGGITGGTEHVADRVHTRRGADRFLHPLHLYRLGKVDKFIVTGGTATILGTGGVTEAEQLRQVLLLAGVPAHNILLETQSRNTRENAANTAELLQKHPELDTLLLVTSAFHMRRSAGCFEKAGLNTTSFSADFYASDRRFTPDEVLIPSIQAFSDWHLLIHEVAGYVIYKIMGYC
ncbi:YdcF family protein [Pontibacter beigongshangensis]|uniref:YdcF family protein n=1 Tax=Pontibacter beigongshangensis TaxID=2574733 RepID=UPI001F5130E6|nr:YdcF family protein [Pontibacter beigongshangensis]